MNTALNRASSIGSVDSAGQLKQVSPVFEELSSLAIAQGQTHDLINELEQRLEAILQPAPPRADPNGEAAPVASKLHGNLMERTVNTVGANGRLAQLIARLTV